MAINTGLDVLMDFRFAYLRAIAYSWTLWIPGKPLHEQPRFIRDQLVSGKDILPLLHSSVPDGPDLGMTCGWPDFAVCVTYDPKPSFEEPSTGWRSFPPYGWVGRDDQFIITLPNQPEPDPDGDVAVIALAEYYKRWPTIMGVDQADHGDVQGVGVPGEAAGGGESALLEFGSVVLRAIALAWQDRGFLSKLTAHDLDDATPVLSQYLGYNNPFNFKIKFLHGGDNPKLIWSQNLECPDQWNWQFHPTERYLKPNSVVLRYPAPPMHRLPPDNNIALHKSVWPFALASYNNTGAAYPFTCMGS